VKNIFGEGIIRVCCRSFGQIDNIPLILNELFEYKLIEAVGMPVKYSYQMKTLVLFIKPTNTDSQRKLYRVFQKISLNYHHFLIESKYPTIEVNENTDDMNNSVQKGEKPEAIPQNETNICIFKSAGEEVFETEELLQFLLLFLKIGLIFLSLDLICDRLE
jgi:CRISPR/Cas system-associated protein endoribonuclease Cas2